MRVVAGAGRFDALDAARYVEHLRVPDLSVGTYSIPAGASDPQQPHSEDELYIVVGGSGRLVGAAGAVAVGPGVTVFVPAGEEHHFTDVTDDLTVLVVFGPAEGTRR